MNDDFLNREIARELLREAGVSLEDEATFEKIWAMCNGNPWDAPMLYKILSVKT